ncbi:MAG: tRNA lysidine(34) synthetase TilS [Candidatus Saccharimonadales bacterium]
MRTEVSKGKYVLAVSGGVDSMVLLDLLAKQPDVELVVAHFNHGMRPDAHKDEELVKEQAKQLRLSFEVGYGRLGSRASEATARNARYEFLEKIQRKHRADAIITAHHQDDLLETAFLNLLRGTNYRGLVAILSNKEVIRPLLNYPKQVILDYAHKNGLEWREDISNQDDTYLRNHIRHNVLPRLSEIQKQELICNIDKVAKIEKNMSREIAKLSQHINKDFTIDRSKFNALPVDLANELLAYWLRGSGIEFDKPTINRLNVALRTSKPGANHPVRGKLSLAFNRRSAQFINSL